MIKIRIRSTCDGLLAYIQLETANGIKEIAIHDHDDPVVLGTKLAKHYRLNSTARDDLVAGIQTVVDTVTTARASFPISACTTSSGTHSNQKGDGEYRMNSARRQVVVTDGGGGEHVLVGIFKLITFLIEVETFFSFR